MAEKYVSGEQYQAMKHTPQSHAKHAGSNHAIGFIVILVVVAGLSFYGGTAYQKSHQPKTASTAASAFGGGGGTGGGFGGGRFGGQRPTIGQVTAVSASSITVQDSRTGASTTLSITSSTQITDNGQTVSASDIQTGDTVLVAASTSDTSQASRILVNPTFGGGGGGGGSGSGGGNASGTSSDTPGDGSDSTITN